MVPPPHTHTLHSLAMLEHLHEEIDKVKAKNRVEAIEKMAERDRKLEEVEKAKCV